MVAGEGSSIHGIAATVTAYTQKRSVRDCSWGDVINKRHDGDDDYIPPSQIR